MNTISTLFQGIGSFFYQEPKIVISRLILMAAGILLVYLGSKHILEPLIMIPMGFGMTSVNAGVLFFTDRQDFGTLFIEPLTGTGTLPEVTQFLDLLQIDFLQPVYSLMFSNGLIACLVFMGVGVMSDVSNVLRYPFTSMMIAACAELGSIVSFPIAIWMGLAPEPAAAIAIVGGADGPMVIFTSLLMAPEYFVAITVIAYLYLSLTYAAYPFMIKLLVPMELRGRVVKTTRKGGVTAQQKLMFCLVANTLLCLLFPVAAPLFASFFLGNAIKESGILRYVKLLEDVFLNSSTFFLGLLLGVLCEGSTLLDPEVLPLLIVGSLALAISGFGGLFGGYVVYWINHKKFNPAIGIAGVSCVPTTAKVAQHEIHLANKKATVLSYAMGANICGVIFSAVVTGVYLSMVPLVFH
ncbi:MAG: sodium ion-translocating decarboxylase subunit beta [Anaerovoracaceae bacterium]|jgi:sodium ion-translocating decarboxylase beta subunit